MQNKKLYMIIVRTAITIRGLGELLRPVVQQFFRLNTHRIHLLYLLHNITIDIFSEESTRHVLVDRFFATFVTIRLLLCSFRQVTSSNRDFHYFHYNKLAQSFQVFGIIRVIIGEVFSLQFSISLHFFALELCNSWFRHYDLGNKRQQHTTQVIIIE